MVKEATTDFNNGMPPFYNGTYSYIQLSEGADEKKVAALAQNILSQCIPATAQGKVDYIFSLQKVQDIHLDSHLADELKPNGNRTFVIALSIAAALILLVAWINYRPCSPACWPLLAPSS